MIVPCGKLKIWSKNPLKGPTIAEEAYVGSPFKMNRSYAKKYSDKWLILSAKYGLIAPDFTIAGKYDVTFNDPSTNPISIEELARARELTDNLTIIIS